MCVIRTPTQTSTQAAFRRTWTSETGQELGRGSGDKDQVETKLRRPKRIIWTFKAHLTFTSDRTFHMTNWYRKSCGITGHFSLSPAWMNSSWTFPLSLRPSHEELSNDEQQLESCPSQLKTRESPVSLCRSQSFGLWITLYLSLSFSPPHTPLPKT